jgi:hypothetical protein
MFSRTLLLTSRRICWSLTLQSKFKEDKRNLLHLIKEYKKSIAPISTSIAWNKIKKTFSWSSNQPSRVKRLRSRGNTMRNFRTNRSRTSGADFRILDNFKFVRNSRGNGVLIQPSSGSTRHSLHPPWDSLQQAVQSLGGSAHWRREEHCAGCFELLSEPHRLQGALHLLFKTAFEERRCRLPTSVHSSRTWKINCVWDVRNGNRKELSFS